MRIEEQIDDLAEIFALNDRQISYFISCNSFESENGKLEFKWCKMPDQSMGREFIELIKKRNAIIRKWISDNPERFKKAVNGYYIP